MVKGISINRKKMTKEETLEHQDGGKNMLSRNWVNTIGFPYPLEFYTHVPLLKQNLSHWANSCGSKCTQRLFVRNLHYK